MQPLVLDNSSSRKSHFIQRPGNKVLSMGLKLRVIIESLRSITRLNSMFKSRNRNNRNGSRRSYRRSRNTINNISRGRIARRGRMSSLRHIISLLRYRSLRIEAFSGSSTWTGPEVAKGGPGDGGTSPWGPNDQNCDDYCSGGIAQHIKRDSFDWRYGQNGELHWTIGT